MAFAIAAWYSRHVLSADWWLDGIRVYRRLDPSVIYFIGLPVVFVDRPLGMWLIFAAGCLSINENMLWRHQLKAYLDWLDVQIDNAAMREWGGKKGGRRAQAKRSRRQTNGLPTGRGADLRACVEEQAEAMRRERRATQRAAQQADPNRPLVLAAPDNRALDNMAR